NERKEAEIAEKPISSNLGVLGALAFIHLSYPFREVRAVRSASESPRKNERQVAKTPRGNIFFSLLFTFPPRPLRLCVHSILINERKEAEIAEKPISSNLGV